MWWSFLIDYLQRLTYKIGISLLKIENVSCVVKMKKMGINCFSLVSLLMIYGKWYNIFGISSTLLQKARDHFYQNAHGMILSSKDHWWILGWSSIIWNVWYAWNKFIFENKFPNKEQIWQRCLFNTWSWMKAFKKDFMVSFQQWQVSPGVCLLNL